MGSNVADNRHDGGAGQGWVNGRCWRPGLTAAGVRLIGWLGNTARAAFAARLRAAVETKVGLGCTWRRRPVLKGKGSAGGPTAELGARAKTIGAEHCR